MRLLLVLILFHHYPTFSKSLKNDGRDPSSFHGKGEIFYNQCISSLYNHPHFVKTSGGVQMGDQQGLMLELDQYCKCHAKEDLKQQELYEKHHIGFFFINKAEYLAGLDICLQEEVSLQNRREFFEVMSTIKLSPIITHELSDVIPSLSEQLSKATKQGSRRECIEEHIVNACRDNDSLYFLFRCLKRKMRDRDFFDQSYATCS
jgi:hypothetical protein